MSTTSVEVQTHVLISESQGTHRTVCYESCFFSGMINLSSENKTNPDTIVVAFSFLSWCGFNWDFGRFVQLVFQRVSEEEDEEEAGTAKQLLTTTHKHTSLFGCTGNSG